MPKEPHLREKQIHNYTGEGQPVSSLVQFVCDTEDVFIHTWCNFFMISVLSDLLFWDLFLLLYLIHLAYPQQQGLGWRRLASS